MLEHNNRKRILLTLFVYALRNDVSFANFATTFMFVLVSHHSHFLFHSFHSFHSFFLFFIHFIHSSFPFLFLNSARPQHSREHE